MTYLAKEKIDRIFENIYNQLRNTNAGIIDGVRLASQCINYLITNNVIKSSEREECCEYVILLFNSGFNNSMPTEHLRIIKQEMLKIKDFHFAQIFKFV